MPTINNNSEPVYVTKDGDRIPYIPETITNAREAYAASMHVLFRHVADFHLCVVKVFSEKYGIPEDDIMRTIHESTEFKQLVPDPALNEIFAKPSGAKKRVVKKKIEISPVEQQEEQQEQEQQQEQEPVPVPVTVAVQKKPAPKPPKQIDALKEPVTESIPKHLEPVTLPDEPQPKNKSKPVGAGIQQKLVFKKK